jgi:hypothetical protein
MPASLVRLGGWRSVGALVVVAAVVTGIAQTGAGLSLLEKAGLIERSSTYTALAFTHPSAPLTVKSAGGKAYYKLSFRIQNAETTSRDYRWSLLLVQHPGQARLIRTEPAFVGPGKTASIPQAGKFTCERNDRVEFIVQLAGRPREAIHAWASCSRPSG